MDVFTSLWIPDSGLVLLSSSLDPHLRMLDFLPEMGQIPVRMRGGVGFHRYRRSYYTLYVFSCLSSATLERTADSGVQQKTS